MSLEDKMNEWDAIHHLASKSEAKPTLHYRKFDTDKQEIVLMGDEHLGAKTYQEYEHLKNVEWCYENKVPIILLGDELETATRHSVGAGVYEQQEILEQQMEHFYHIYRPLAKEGLILGQHIGGHEARAFKESGVNVTKIMCKELKIPYFGIGKFHHFRVGNQGYDLYTTHGASGARLPHTKIKATLDLAHAMAVEIYAMGHLHQLTHHTRHFYRIDKRNKKVIQASKDFIISGGYVGYWGSYAHMKNLEPVKIGSAKLKLHGTEKLVRVSL